MIKRGKALLLSIGISGISAAALLAVAALIFEKMGTLPKGITPVFTTIIGGMAAFLGGFFAALYQKENGLLLGLLSGAVFTAVILLVASLFFENEFSVGSVGKLAAVLIGGSLGGILGVNQKSKVKF